MEFYFNLIEEIDKFITEFRADICDTWFKDKTEFKIGESYFLTTSQRHSWNILQQIVSIIDVFGIDVFDMNKKGLEVWLDILEVPPTPIKWSDLDKHFGNIQTVFQIAKAELVEKINFLDTEERVRLNEALNCYIQELNYSTIVMSVSAIESRLFSLMKSQLPTAHLEKLTLGELIKKYLENKEEFGNVIPRKHLPLLQYCNEYRVFSVHPKKEKINRANATTILCMTCGFLFDKEMKIKK